MPILAIAAGCKAYVAMLTVIWNTDDDNVRLFLPSGIFSESMRIQGHASQAANKKYTLSIPTT